MRPNTEASDSYDAINVKELLWKELPSTFHRATFFEDMAKNANFSPFFESIETFSLDPTLGVVSEL